jgi:tRNA pseudouridine38-40 synthase
VRTLKLTVEYDGTNYVGWQRQPNGISIQGLLEDALAPVAGAAVTVHGAGRTDAGVHALGQVASLSVTMAHSPETLQRALNAVLPAEVRIVAVDDAPAGFHARYSAIGKVYEYRIVNAPFVSSFLYRYAWHVRPPLDVDAMRAAARALIGRHDFAGFQAAGSPVRSTVRTIHAFEWRTGRRYNEPLAFTISGDGFLRHMVRTIAGTLVEVGLGRWPAARIGEILAGNRAQGGPSAPASGLFLVSVLY